MKTIDPELLATFLAVVEHGGFTAAAHALHRSQAAVSAQIRRLEEETGAILMTRNSRGLRLTDHGRLLEPESRRLLEANAAVLARLAAETPPAIVHLGVMEDYATRILPPLLAEFARCHPEVRLHVRTGLTTALLDRLGGELDLVLAMHAAGSARGHPLRLTRPIWLGCATGSTPLPEPLPLALAPPGCLFRAWAIAALDGIGRSWRLAYESPSIGAVEAAAAAGLAVTVGKPESADPALCRLGRTTELPELPPAEIVLHVPPSPSGTVKRLADFLGQALGTERLGPVSV
jgi:DNA-binding transcriptional LysR family regulator